SPAGEPPRVVPAPHARACPVRKGTAGAGRFAVKPGALATGTAGLPRELRPAPGAGRMAGPRGTWPRGRAGPAGGGTGAARGPRLRGPRADRRRTGRTTCCLLRAACCLLPAACCLLPCDGSGAERLALALHRLGTGEQMGGHEVAGRLAVADRDDPVALV